MKRVIPLVSQVLVLLLLVSSPALAWGRYGWRYYHGGWHHYYGPRVVVGVGVGPWWGPPWGYYPAPYPGAYPPPVVVTQAAPAPPVYVERDDAPPAAMDEPSAPGPQDTGAYWYYCPGARAYYPKVPNCPEQWVKVPAGAE
jgi:hypothetical protein